MRHLLSRLVVSVVVILICSHVEAQEIRIGQPKAWRYDRMFPVEDGLLRDVEGINISSLTGLDANEMNSRVVDLLQTYVSASVNFDQTAGIQNALAMDTLNATRSAQLTQLKDQASTTHALADQKAQLAKTLLNAIDMQTKAKAANCLGVPSQGIPTCQGADKTVNDLNAQIKSLNDASSAIGSISATAPTSPTLTGVSGGTPITTPALTPLISGSDFMKSALANDPKTVIGSLPARERLQSFITLLNDRLTHQLALSLDERGLSHDYVPVVLEFDVAIEPNANRKEQRAVSVFTLKPGIFSPENSCYGKRPVVYNLYPSLAAFNVSEVQGQSSGFYANGGFKGLFLGSNISFQRQHDHIMSAMAQSVYISGFREKAVDAGNDVDRFGWYYGAPAYSKIVRPGIYTTFAVVLIPRKQTSTPVEGQDKDADNVCEITLNATAHWEKKNGKKDKGPDLQFPPLINSAQGPVVPDNNSPLVRQVQYWPHYGQKSDLQKDMNVVAIEFEQPVDPNLLITASGKLLKRVRDWRGRATTPQGTGDSVSITDSTGTAHAVSFGRGLLESNYDEADTWIAVSQKRILVKLSYATTGATDFPSIRLLAPGGADTDLRDAVDDKSYASRISIGGREFYACHPKLSAYKPEVNEGCMKQPNSLWLPLFIQVPEKDHKLRVVKVDAAEKLPASTANAALSVGPAMMLDVKVGISGLDVVDGTERTRGKPEPIDAPDNSKNGEQQYIFLSLDDGKLKLSPSAQVLLVAPAHSRFAHPVAMECAPLGAGLLCHLHPQTITFNTPTTQTDVPPNAEPLSCLIKDGKALPRSLEENRFCNWRNFRLQVIVTQTSNDAEGTPTILAAADFPTTDATLPIIGLARAAEQRTTEDWQFAFPVWYGTELPLQQKQFCIGDETGREISGTTANIASDPLGDFRRASVLTVVAPKESLSTFLFSHLFLYDCSIRDGRHRLEAQLGSLTGVDKLILPDNLLLTKAGTNNSFYQFTGTNTDRVKEVTFGKPQNKEGKRMKSIRPHSVRPDPVRGGFIVDLSVQTKVPEESLLYFEIGGLEIPAIACWNTDPKSSQVCGQVVVKTSASEPATIATPKVENPTTSTNPVPENPTAKVSVRPD